MLISGFDVEAYITCLDNITCLPYVGGVDFLQLNIGLMFTSTTLEDCFTVPIIDDVLIEEDETFVYEITTIDYDPRIIFDVDPANVTITIRDSDVEGDVL